MFKRLSITLGFNFLRDNHHVGFMTDQESKSSLRLCIKEQITSKIIKWKPMQAYGLNIHLISLLAMTGNTSFFFCPTHVCHFITALSVQSWMKVNINVQRMNKSYLQIHAMSQSNGQRKHKINTVNGSKSSFYFPQSICEVYMMRQMCLGRKCGRKDVLLNVWINSFNAAAELP